jgi:hypothetical protein
MCASCVSIGKERRGREWLIGLANNETSYLYCGLPLPMIICILKPLFSFSEMSGVEIATWVHRKHNIKLGNIGKRGRGRGGEKSIILLHIEFRSWTSDHIFFIESVTSCKTILVGLSPHNGHRRNFLIQWYLARQGLNKVCIPQCIKHTSDVSMHIFHPWNVIQC